MKPEMTKRQEEVLLWVQRGLSNKNIGKRLGISESTVKQNVGRLMKAYGVQNRNQLAAYSSQGKVVELPEMTGLEAKPVGWVLRDGDTVRGFASGKQPSDEWVPVYAKR